MKRCQHQKPTGRCKNPAALGEKFCHVCLGFREWNKKRTSAKKRKSCRR